MLDIIDQGFWKFAFCRNMWIKQVLNYFRRLILYKQTNRRQGSRSPYFWAGIWPHSRCQELCFSPIPNKIPNLTKKNIFLGGWGGVSSLFFFYIIQIQNILLHICKKYVKYSLLALEEKFVRNIDDSVVFVVRTR